MTTEAGPRKLMVVIGTRPEAIKLAPIVLLAQKRGRDFAPFVVTTGQHREMLDQMMQAFDIEADVDLEIMKPDQTLSHVTTAALEGLDRIIRSEAPDCVVVQGDTSTTFAGALAAFYQGVPVAHVEAGLRTFDKTQPFPEEINRRLTTQLTDFHFAPTDLSRQNLLREGVEAERIWVTGNSAIDALLLMQEKSRSSGDMKRREGRTILLTAHRRENHGAPMEEICDAVLELLERYGDLRVVYPVHMSPRVRQVVFGKLSGHPRVELTEPLDYTQFVWEMSQAHLILTDSGGVQEEAPSLGKPVLVMRETTERPEAVQAGVALLVGADRQRIVETCSSLLDDESRYRQMARAQNPYGDGTAAEKILGVLTEALAAGDPGERALSGL